MNRGSREVLPRFFSMTETTAVPLVHRDYGRQVQGYFHRLFPGRQWTTFGDLVQNPLPVDVEVLYPTVEEPFYLLHTMGMSAFPMQYPAGGLVESGEVYSELCLMLPASWPFHHPAHIALHEEAAWPIWMLMELGRFPHVHHLWLSYGFVLPNGEQCEPFSLMTDLSGIVIVQFEGELGELTMEDGTAVNLLMPVLVYKEEMALCDTMGVDAVIDSIVDINNGSFLLDMKRPRIEI